MNAQLKGAAMPASTENITVLRTKGGLRMTKRWLANGTIEGYDNAKYFLPRTVPVTNIHGLSGLLSKIEGKPDVCIIRGGFIGEARAVEMHPPKSPGHFVRNLDLFKDRPIHTVLIDSDKFVPSEGLDLVNSPVAAIEEYIAKVLPEAFHGASYHWQLSSSAGSPDAKAARILKVHLWYWLETPRTCDELRAWADTLGPMVDRALYNPVQAHFTACPVFAAGVLDPVPVRSGFVQGLLGDEVPLELSDTVLAWAKLQAGRKDNDMEIADPREKPGVIGAFCRAYPISRVIEEILPEEFVFVAGSDRRVTWLNGGSPEGCFVRGDDLHLGSRHNTDPLDNRLANAFDLVRCYKFGHLDADLTDDERALYALNEMPSQRAMVAWARSLPEIANETVVAAQASRATWLEAVRACETETALRTDVLPAAMLEKASLSKADLDVLTLAVQAKMRVFTGVRVTMAIARGLLREAAQAGHGSVDRTAAPFWAQPFVFVTNGDVFLNTETKERMTRQGFDFSFNRFMAPFMDADGNVPAPSAMASSTWHMDCVANVAYNPTLNKIFEMSGQMYANTYSDANIPAVPPVLTDTEEAAWALIVAHVNMLFPEPREAALFMDWLAHNVQFPGRKIRWSPFVYGVQGSGKSFFQTLLEATMGPDNVSPLDAETLIASAFNEWANRTAVVVIEEVKIPDHSARETDNKLKPVITNNVINIHPKGAKTYPVINVTNYLLFSNHPDGLPLTEEDRRYMALRVAVNKEQVKELSDSGYYEKLFGAVESCSGAMRKRLLEWQFSTEFNPNGHAPWTAAKGVVIELCKSDSHNALEDLIKDGHHGVTPLVISSAHLSAAAKDKTGAPIYTTTVQKLLMNSGFDFFDRIKWDGGMQRVWIHDKLVSALSGNKKTDKATLREMLDASGFDEEFLK